MRIIDNRQSQPKQEIKLGSLVVFENGADKYLLIRDTRNTVYRLVDVRTMRTEWTIQNDELNNIENMFPIKEIISADNVQLTIGGTK